MATPDVATIAPAETATTPACGCQDINGLLARLDQRVAEIRRQNALARDVRGMRDQLRDAGDADGAAVATWVLQRMGAEE